MSFDWKLYLPELQLLLTTAVVAVVLYFVAHWVTRILSRITRRFPYINEILIKAKSPAHLLIPLFGTQAVWSSASDDFAFIEFVRHVNTLAIIAGFTWLGLKVAKSIENIIRLKNPLDVENNLDARRIQTQTQVLTQTISFFVILFGLAIMLMTFPGARQIGTSLLASAGVAGLAVGFAAKPVLGNLIAGLQIAITQPIRLDDVVIVANEWGRIEEITGTYVVVRIWDERRLIVPLQWFIENPFQNWTRQTSQIIGSIFFWVDYSVGLEALRQEMERLLKEVPELWDGRVKVLQVTDTSERAIQIRILASSSNSSSNWDLRCYLREKMITYVSANFPDSLPRMRATISEKPVDESHEDDLKTPERQPPV